MNRQINLTQSTSIQTTLIAQPLFDLQYQTTNQMQIKTLQVDSGMSFSSIPFTLSDGKLFAVSFQSYNIDVSARNINIANQVCGVVSDPQLESSQANATYSIFAFADENGNEAGFGLWREYTSSMTTTGATKGSTLDLTNTVNSNYLRVNDRVKIDDSTNWNLGTVSSIDNTTVTVAMDENSRYGGDIASGSVSVSVESEPIPHDLSQTLIAPYFRKIARMKLDSTGSIMDWMSCKPDPTRVGTILPWHKNIISGESLILPHGYEQCNGQECSTDKSALIGQSLPDLNTENRFLRGSTISGTMQNATNVTNQVTTGGSTKLQIPIQNPDEVIEVSTGWAYTREDSAGDTLQIAAEYNRRAVRPKNMSVVWIMRVGALSNS